MKTLIKSLAIALIACGAYACNNGTPADGLTSSGLDPKNFIDTVQGQPMALYTLHNAQGMEACITNYGGRLVSLMVPDREGRLTDVVLGHDSIADYEHIDGNFGALIGRYGNRIAQGRFSLDGTAYQLPQNNYGHCLHGGPQGYHTRVWDVKGVTDSTLTLALHSPDGEAGFPANLDVEVTYALLSDNTLQITYDAVTDAPTVCNLTNHSYFNLSGDGSRTILDHELQIEADSITPVDSTFMTSGVMMAVKDTPFDFTTAKAIGRDIAADDEQLHNANGYDHNYVLRSGASPMRRVATLKAPATGITMDVITDQPGLQVYVGNFLDGTVKGKHGIAYPQRSAICLETQHYPNTPNHPQWPTTRLNPGEPYHTVTAYHFTAGK